MNGREEPSKSHFETAAFVLSLIAILASYLVAERIYERVPHLEDEIAYVWQAKAMAGGEIAVPSPILPKKFLVPFVVDYEGLRFGKYPLGWPALLSVGVRFGLRDFVNPLLAGLAVWLTYRLGQRLLGEIAGLIAAVLTLTSPFFLMNAGSLLSHPLGLVLSLAFALAWWDVVDPPGAAGESALRPGLPRWLPTLTAGAVLGAFALVRPFTALGVAIPFGLHGLYCMVRGSPALRRRLVALAALAAGIGSLHFLWQAAVTGDPFLNPYELWWPYDRVGFGPGVGRIEGGHNLWQGWANTKTSLRAGANDLFGWPGFSWLLLPFGLWAGRRNLRLWMAVGVVISLLGMYMAYWIGAWTFGPRYQFEALYGAALVSAAGLCWLAGWPMKPGEAYVSAAGPARIRRLGVTAVTGPARIRRLGVTAVTGPARIRRLGVTAVTGPARIRRLGVTAAAGLLLSVNLAFYLPARMDSMVRLYSISREALAPFEAAGDLAPAVIVVHTDRWMSYGALLELQDPFLTSPFIFVWGDRPGLRADLEAEFPERALYHYYPEEPGKFYTDRRIEEAGP